MDSLIIRILELPPEIKGLTLKDENGDYNIYLNSCISDDARVKAYLHELEHIKKGHFILDSSIAYHIEKSMDGA